MGVNHKWGHPKHPSIRKEFNEVPLTYDFDPRANPDLRKNTWPAGNVNPTRPDLPQMNTDD